MNRLTNLIGTLFGAALAASVAHAQDPKDIPQKSGVTPTDLIVRGVDGTANLDFTVIDVKYEPGGVNRRHFHPAAVTFYVVSGTPVFQQEGKDESPRILRRLHTLRRWSHEQEIKPFFT